MFEPIDQREDLLNFVTDEVPAHLVGLTIDPLPMRLVGEPVEGGIAGPVIVAIDQDGHDHQAAVLRETPGELRLRRHTGLEPRQHLGRLIRVRHRHHARDWRAFGLKQEALAVDVIEHQPADGVHRVSLRLRHGGIVGGGVLEFEAGHDIAQVHGTQKAAQPFAVGIDGLGVSRGRGEIALPEAGAFLNGFLGGFGEEPVDAFDHAGRDIARPVERGGAWQGGGRGLSHRDQAGEDQGQPGPSHQVAGEGDRCRGGQGQRYAS